MIKFDFDDILIEPEILTNIDSRSIINPYKKNYLPLMTAPMDTVIDKTNETIFDSHKIIPVLPRGEFTSLKNSFISISLLELDKFLSGELNELDKYNNILIDIANGHMIKLFDFTKKFKEKYPTKKLMIGNIANPKTFDLYTKLNVDYIRIGIGNGGACLTTQQLGVGYPMASLISECYKIKLKNKSKVKIVADGGMKKYSDIIKALAIGADYVMLGSILNKALESCAETYIKENRKLVVAVINQYTEGLELFNKNIPIYKNFRGMSTKEVQKKWNKKTLTTSEGVVKKQQVEYTLSSWVENFESYLRSSMSYTNSKNLKQFKKSNFNHISFHAYNRFSK